MDTIEIRRFSRDDSAAARQMFALMAQVFEEEDAHALSDAYVRQLLGRDEFWALAAFIDGELVGGLTAHTLPMTRAEISEIFIYDIAVHATRQRQGVGRRLIAALREMAAADGVGDLFVPADDDDTHALEFYRALGGAATPVTLFVFSADHDD